MTVYVVTFRGIGERLVGNLLDGYVAALPADWVRIEVAWAASYGPVPDPFGISYDRSLASGEAVGIAKLRAIRAQDPDATIIVAGYSGGAALAGNISRKIRSEIGIDLVVLVADPNNPHGTDYGIAGARPVPGRTLWVSNARDVICSCPRLSPLRIIATLTPLMGLGVDDAWRGTQDVARKLADPRVRASMAEQIGPWWSPVAWARYERARVDADGYLSQREHVQAYTRRTAAGSMLTQAAARTRELVSTT